MQVSDDEKCKDPYIYKHVEASKGKVASILPYRFFKNKLQFLVVEEMRPAWDLEKLEKKYLCSITGCIEGNDHLIETAQKELKEETGYSVNINDIEFLGNSFATKASDTLMFLYTVNLTGLNSGEKSGDGSQMENDAKPIWIEDITDVRDPIVAQIYVRIMKKLKNQ